jgi:hypothetical protein
LSKNVSEDSELRTTAREIAEDKLGFYVHLAAYAVVNSLIFLSWWYSGGLYVWIFPWFLFPLVGWGAGLLVHYMSVFTPHWSQGYIESRTEKEYRKLKRVQEDKQRTEETTSFA